MDHLLLGLFSGFMELLVSAFCSEIFSVVLNVCEVKEAYVSTHITRFKSLITAMLECLVVTREKYLLWN